MKIAIQGHSTRGKEVIRILESLGGKTVFTIYGFDDRYCYYINPNGIIIESLITIETNDKFSLYTLEEFEKKFPFKIGNDVIITGLPDYPKVITKMTWMDNEIFYTFGDNTWYNTGALRKLEMKEERNITLTLDKAKEWYKKGGELKEIALQAFTEKELNPLPRSWEEFCENYPVQVGECWLENCDKIREKEFSHNEKRIYKNWMPARKSAEAHLAMIQLEQLRNCWWNSWGPDWNDDQQPKYCVTYYHGEFKIRALYEARHFLSFPTKEMAEEFLECFRDLIEKAGDLI